MYSLIEYKDYYYPDDFIIKLLKENNVITKMSKKELESYLNFNNSFYALIINLIYNIKLLNAKQYYYQDLMIYYEDDKDINTLKEIIKSSNNYKKRKLSLE